MQTTRRPASTQPDLVLSLEPHLINVLRPLPPLLPPELASQLSTVLPPDGPVSSPTISYALLSSISRWARSPTGEVALRSHYPPLQPHDYAMVPMLAGARTSPHRKFPSSPASDSQAVVSRQELNDRRAITALVNALLSVGGSGAATWWAAEKLAWKDEWKVSLALLVSLVVATSEAILYIIWEARRSKVSTRNGVAVHTDPRASAPSHEKECDNVATSTAVNVCNDSVVKSGALFHRDAQTTSQKYTTVD